MIIHLLFRNFKKSVRILKGLMERFFFFKQPVYQESVYAKLNKVPIDLGTRYSTLSALTVHLLSRLNCQGVA